MKIGMVLIGAFVATTCVSFASAQTGFVPAGAIVVECADGCRIELPAFGLVETAEPREVVSFGGLPAGVYDVRIEASGGSWELDVTVCGAGTDVQVVAGDATVMPPTCRPFGQLALTLPLGASADVAGRTLRTSTTAAMYVGTYDVVLTNAEAERRTVEAVVTEGETTEIEFPPPTTSGVPLAEAWTNQFGTSEDEAAWRVAVDAAGNILVTGYTSGDLAGENAGDSDAFVMKLDPQGRELWIHQFGTTDEDYVSGIAVDAAGDILVAGSTEGDLAGENAGAWDTFVMKLDPQGRELWTHQFGTIEKDYSEGVAVDAAGNILVTGLTEGDLADGKAGDGGADAFVVKLDPHGRELWTHQFGTIHIDWAEAVAVDAAGNILVTGATMGDLAGENEGYTNDAFVLKLDSDGRELWTRQFGASDVEVATAIAVDVVGNILVTGYIFGELADENARYFIDAFVQKLDPQGRELWIHQFGTTGDDYGNGIAVDAAGDILVAGSTDGDLGGESAGAGDAFVIKLDLHGDELWTHQFGTGQTDRAEAIVLDAVGNILITGSTMGDLASENAGSNDTFVRKLRPERSVH